MSSIKMVLACLLASVVLCGPAQGTGGMGPSTPPGSDIPQYGCDEPDDPCPPPGSMPVPPAQEYDNSCGIPACPLNEPDPEPPPASPISGKPRPATGPDDDPCGPPGKHNDNQTDAPDSLPTLGERVRLQAVFGTAGPVTRWGRHIGFGSMGRLNFLSKAHLTTDFLYLRIADPNDNSTAVFERDGQSWEYTLAEAVGYPAETIVRLDNPAADGVPLRLFLSNPDGSSITMERETETPASREIDGHIYRVTERRTRRGHAVTFVYAARSVVITDASGHEYVCLTDWKDRITEISFTVEGETRRWQYEYDDNKYSGADSYVTEVNMQTGKRIQTWLRGRLTVTDMAILGADGAANRSEYRPFHPRWNHNGLKRNIDRAVSGAFEHTYSEGKARWIYTPKGLTQRTDQLENVTVFERNDLGKYTRKTDALGQVMERTYDPNGRLLSKKGSDGSETVYTYSRSGGGNTSVTAVVRKKVSSGGEDWTETVIQYDAHGDPVSFVHPEGGETRYLRSPDGLITHILHRVDSGRWSAVAYTYNGNGQAVSESQAYFITDPEQPDAGRPAADALTIEYDTWGNQVSRTDALGRRSTFEYDSGNRLIAETDPLGNRSTYEYNGIGRLSAAVDALGHRTVIDYNKMGKVILIRGAAAGSAGCGSCAGTTSLLGLPGTYAWSSDGLLNSYTDLAGVKNLYGYDEARRKIWEENAEGARTRYDYDELGQLIRVTDPEGGVMRFAYDAGGRRTEITDPLGNTTRTEYDLAGRTAAVIGSDGSETRWQRDSEGRITAVRTRIDAGTWRERRMAYDLAGNLMETTDGFGTPEASVIRYEYDAGRRLTAMTADPDGLAVTVRTEYDAAGNAVRTIDGNGSVTRRLYDAAGRLTEEISPEGRRRTIEYDAMGNVTLAIADPDGAAQFTGYVYDAAGNLLEWSNGMLAETYGYDAAGRQVLRNVPGRGSIATVYGVTGLPAELRHTAGTETLVTAREYDAAGRVKKVIDPAGHAVTYGYDAAGNITSLTDALGAVTRIEYGADGRQSRVILPHGGERRFFYNLAGDLIRTEGGPEGTLRYTYDAAGRQTAVTDANGRSRTLQYDAAGRVVRMQNEMGQPVTYTYDGAGNRLTLRDANMNLSVFTYDRDGYLTSLSYPAALGQPADIERYRYDNAGRLTEKITPNGDSIRFLYDPAGNVSAMYHGPEAADPEAIPAENLIARYTYAPSGDVASEEDPNTAMLYEYDGFGRLVQAKDRTLNKSTQYEYDPRGLRSVMRVIDHDGGSVSMRVAYGHDAAGRMVSVQKDNDPAALYEYDAAGRRTRLTLPNGVVTQYTYDMEDRLLDLTTKRGNDVLARFAYTLDPTGNRTGITYADGSRSVYGFDDAYRLTKDRREAADGSELYDERFTYDAVGNRLTKVRTGWNPVDVQYTYNERNQLIATSGTENRTWQYNANGSLVRTLSKAGNEEMEYDVLNRMTRYAGPAGTEESKYRGSEWHRWKNTKVDGSIDTYFLYDNNNIVADFNAEESKYVLYVMFGIDENLSLSKENTSKYYLTDAMGSVIGLTDGMGDIEENIDYTAFGESITESFQRYGMHGRESSFGYVYFRYRNYLPKDGVFSGRDPKGYDINLFRGLYSFVNANPILLRDPFGLEDCQIVVHNTQEEVNRIFKKARQKRFFDYLRDSRAKLLACCDGIECPDEKEACQREAIEIAERYSRQARGLYRLSSSVEYGGGGWMGNFVSTNEGDTFGCTFVADQIWVGQQSNTYFKMIYYNATWKKILPLQHKFIRIIGPYCDLIFTLWETTYPSLTPYSEYNYSPSDHVFEIIDKR